MLILLKAETTRAINGLFVTIDLIMIWMTFNNSKNNWKLYFLNHCELLQVSTTMTWSTCTSSYSASFFLIRRVKNRFRTSMQ